MDIKKENEPCEILALDPGTNSCGFAGINLYKRQELVFGGVRIFQEGFTLDKNNEQSKAAFRSSKRSGRTLIKRRRLRKISLVRVLISAHLCPELTDGELKLWRQRKRSPQSLLFNEWLSDSSKNDPYTCRYRCLTEVLDLDVLSNRYILGKALYHICQRRGYRGLRQDTSSESGVVKKSILELSQKIESNHCHYLGEYLYHQKEQHRKIRNLYTDRDEHYHKEVVAICEKQHLDAKLTAAIVHSIFFQHPLLSQKNNISACRYESHKRVSHQSHPLNEELRTLQLINNIKIKSPSDSVLRHLNIAERAKIIPCFFRVSKPNFDFSDIAKVLCGKNRYYFFKDEYPSDAFVFNYRSEQSIAGCSTLASIGQCFDKSYLEEVQSMFLSSNRGYWTEFDKKNDLLWHSLFDFQDSKALQQHAMKVLHMSEEHATRFSKINLRGTYGAYSLSVVKKILPYLHFGYSLNESLLLCNIPAVKLEPGYRVLSTEERTGYLSIYHQSKLENLISRCINELLLYCKENNYCVDGNSEALVSFKSMVNAKVKSVFFYEWKSYSDIEKQDLFQKVYNGFINQSGLDYRLRHLEIKSPEKRLQDVLLAESTHNLPAKLYLPQEDDKFPDAEYKDGKLQLASLDYCALKNPAVMRSLRNIRAVVNELLLKGAIDSQTEIRIEYPRELNDRNTRKALSLISSENAKARSKAVSEIQQIVGETIPDVVVNDDLIYKYQLWLEQGRMDFYALDEHPYISFLDVINGAYDVEHTIPISRGGTSERYNNTLCKSEYNRQIKRNCIPSECPNYESILQRAIDIYDPLIVRERQMIFAITKSLKSMSEKEKRDAAIVKRFLSRERLKYYESKLKTFKLKDIEDGFKLRQKSNIGIVSKYTNSYLSTVFKKPDNKRSIFVVTGLLTSSLRKEWGLQRKEDSKDRSNHVHHFIDAAVIGCTTNSVLNLYNTYLRDKEDYKCGLQKFRIAPLKLPWSTFTDDVLQMSKELLVSYDVKNNLLKSKNLRRLKCEDNNSKVYYVQKSDCVRGSLSKDTFYSAIKIGGEVVMTERKKLTNLNLKDVENIVDKDVRQIVSDYYLQYGEAIFKGEIPVWRNKEKGILIKSVKCKTINPAAKNPLILSSKLQSKKDYKRNIYTVNDGNYGMAVYEGTDAKGRHVIKYVAMSNYDAVKHRKELKFTPELQGIPFRALIKRGTLLIQHDNDPDSVKLLTKEELQKRIFIVTKINNKATTVFCEIKAFTDSTSNNYIDLPKSRWMHLVEHKDFKIHPDGEIEWQF